MITHYDPCISTPSPFATPFSPPPPPECRHKARHKSSNVPACKHRHENHEHLVKDQPLKTRVSPEASPCDIQTASQNNEEPCPSQVMAAPAQAKQSYLAWFDGACEPVNPGGTASFGVIIKNEDGTVISEEYGLVGRGDAMSNNMAEYAGVRHVLRYLASRPPGRAMIHGDSNLVINQLNGKWRVRKGLYLAIAMETKELLAHLRGLGWQINFCWIPREQNEECDMLSKNTADKPDSIHSLRIPV